MKIQYDKIEIFKNNVSSFKETSKDSDSGTSEYMTQSEIEVINFDKVKDDYIKGMHLSSTPCSNDALYISKDGEVYFVEFKNGRMKKEKVFNVYNKIYDSLLIFNDIIGANISFCREHVNFVLVYNESKNPCENGDIQNNGISNDESNNEDSPKARIGKYFTAKANKRYIRFDLERFKKIYFHDVFTYTENEFEKNFLGLLSGETVWGG